MENINNKNKVLKNIESIKTILLDKDTSLPIKKKALVMWSLVAFILTAFSEFVFKNFGLVLGFSFILFFIITASILEVYYTKKLNYKFNINNLSNKQKKNKLTFYILTFSASLLTLLFIKFNLESFIYPFWLFFIGLSFLNTDIIHNIKIFKIFACAYIIIAYLMFGALFFFTYDLKDIFKLLTILIFVFGNILLSFLI